jgi:hypothetical protein
MSRCPNCIRPGFSRSTAASDDSRLTDLGDVRNNVNLLTVDHTAGDHPEASTTRQTGYVVPMS